MYEDAPLVVDGFHSALKVLYFFLANTGKAVKKIRYLGAY